MWLVPLSFGTWKSGVSSSVSDSRLRLVVHLSTPALPTKDKCWEAQEVCPGPSVTVGNGTGQGGWQAADPCLPGGFLDVLEPWRRGLRPGEESKVAGVSQRTG